MNIAKRCMVLYVALSLSLQGHGQDVSSLSVRGTGMGGAAVSLQDAGSAWAHVAAAAFVDKATLQLAAHNPYLLQELNTVQIGVMLPRAAFAARGNNGTFSLLLSREGGKAFGQQSLAAAYALRLSPRMALGTALRYRHAGSNDSRYQDYHYLSLAVGFQWRVSQTCLIGLSLNDPYPVSLAETDAVIAARPRLNIGMSYRPLPELLATIEVEQRADSKTKVMAGVEYRPLGGLYLRTGFSTLPMSYAFGIGYRKAWWGLDIAVQRHHLLGLSPQFALTLTL